MSNKNVVYLALVPGLNLRYFANNKFNSPLDFHAKVKQKILIEESRKYAKLIKTN